VNELNHFNQNGQAHMVDVSAKNSNKRSAVVSGAISMEPATLAKIRQGNHKKGDVLGIARIAGIMAAKQTATLIPLCHPIPIEHINIDFQIIDDKNQVKCIVIIETSSKTGIEMEALTATQIALLTIYDMCKAVDKKMIISDIKLLEKHGGKSGIFIRDEG